MHESWLEVVDRVLRPARPRLAPCLRERELHVAARARAAQERARALMDCQDRIERARAAVVAANDGVVTSLMTELEREWRTLARPDPDGGLMDLWTRIAPSSWLDRKRWRDSEPPSARLDAAIALAADVDGVEAAEAAAESLRVAIAAWGTPIGSRLRWSAFDADAECVTALLAATLREAQEVVAAQDTTSVTLTRARELERVVHEAALLRLPDRPLFAQAIAHAAFVDCFLRTPALAGRPNPVTPLRELWKTGYTLAAIDASSTTLEIPPL